MTLGRAGGWEGCLGDGRLWLRPAEEPIPPKSEVLLWLVEECRLGPLLEYERLLDDLEEEYEERELDERELEERELDE